MTTNNVITLPRRGQTDPIEQAFAEGRPTPLAVMLQQMWKYLDDAALLEASGNPDDDLVARVLRDRALHIAREAAPYVNPKKTAVAHTAEPIVHEHYHHRFATMSDDEVRQHLQAVIGGASILERLNDAETA